MGLEVIFQTLDGKSYSIFYFSDDGSVLQDYSIDEINNDYGIRLYSYDLFPHYLIRYDGKVLMQNGSLLNPNIKDAIYLN